MSYSTTVYLFTPRQQIVVFGGDSARRYEIVYAKNLTLNKGVLNTLQFQFINQQQKPVDITGVEITCRVLNNTGTRVLLQKALSITLALTGLAELVVEADEIQAIDAQAGYYTLEIKPDPTQIVPGKPVFVNSESAVRGVMNIVNSTLPSFVPSRVVTIPTYDVPTETNPRATNTATLPPFYSSEFPNSGALTTIQTEYLNFTGNVQIQGSVDGVLSEGGWYNIGNVKTYTNQWGSEVYEVGGFHPYLRLQFLIPNSNANTISGLIASNALGTISKILVR
jgi:hypothetical protein